MKLDKTNFALAAGFTGAIISFVMQLLMRFMHWGGMMHMRGAMMHMGKGMSNMSFQKCTMCKWGLIAAPIIMFFVAGGAGWLFAFFYNKLSQK